MQYYQDYRLKLPCVFPCFSHGEREREREDILKIKLKVK